MLQGHASRKRFRPSKLHMLVVLASVVALGTLLTFISIDAKANRAEKLEPTANIDNPKLQMPLALPDLTEERDSSIEADTQNWQTHTVKKGESLAIIFRKQHLSPQVLHAIMTSAKSTATLRQLHPGQKLDFLVDEDGHFQKMIYHINQIHSLQVGKSDTGYTAQLHEKPIESRTTYASATIEDSLFMAGQKAGLSDALVMQLAAIFGWDIDFALDIRQGDKFTVLYKEEFLDGKKLRDGDILAASFTNHGHTYRAIRFTDDRGHSDYYTPKGLSMRKAFLRTPVDFRRISSRFGMRYHPILHRKRMHTGVDYAAPRGTPIKTTGDGKIIFRGRKGGYGNAIIIKHGGIYSTLYGHMSHFRRGMHVGSYVKQGQIIGYVGSTGRATGPHLHYEFRVNGVHRNPLTVKLPNAAPIAPKYRTAFRQQAQSMLAQLKMHTETQVALH